MSMRTDDQSCVQLKDLVVCPPGSCRSGRIRSVELLVSDAETYAVGRDEEVSEVSRLVYSNLRRGDDDLRFEVDSDFRVQGTATLETTSEKVERITGKVNGVEYCLEMDSETGLILCKKKPGLSLHEFLLLSEWSESLGGVTEHLDVAAKTGSGPPAAKKSGCAGLFFASVGYGLGCGASLGIWKDGCQGAKAAWLGWKACREAKKN